ncbi:hypothetical protein F5X99DRAFT_410235 [Biscogniauxia marginata]|nr:hypothetical protein F5X99DRAFT_410235 [Biscogniauxia marginata]
MSIRSLGQALLVPLEWPEGTYGAGSYTDTGFTSVPGESGRILKYMTGRTTNFANDPELLEVNLVGIHLAAIPENTRSVAVTATLHDMEGIIGHEILTLRVVSTDEEATVNTNQVALYLNQVGPFGIGERQRTLDSPKSRPRYEYGHVPTWRARING